MKGGGSSALPQDPEAQKTAFDAIEKYGPKEAKEIENKRFGFASQLTFLFVGLLLTIPLIVVGWLGAVFAMVIGESMGTVLWNALLGAGLIFFGMVCRALIASITLRPPELVNLLRRGAFASLYWIGAVIGVIAGISLTILIRQYMPSLFLRPGSLIEKAFDRDPLIITATALVFGLIAGYLGIVAREKANKETAIAYINEWAKSRESRDRPA